MLKPYDIVKFKNNGKDCFGYIEAIKNDKYLVFIFGISKTKWFSENRLQFVEPKVYDKDTISQIVRYENLKFLETLPPISGCVDGVEKYTVTLDDILVALGNIKNNPSFCGEWKVFIKHYIIGGLLEDFVNLPSDQVIIEGFPSEYDVFLGIDAMLDKCENPLFGVDEAIQHIITFKDNLNKPFYDWVLNNKEKECFLQEWEEDEMLNKADEKVVELLRKFSLELAEDGNEIALRTLAYSFYSGNKLFNQDSVKSRDYLLKLLPYDKGGYYANSLGYIYYYGRCNSGEPQYEEAFKYFSIGHCHGLYESTYKLADMFSNGHCVNKDKHVAYNLISGIYVENLRNILESDNTKFADVALRMGNLAADKDINGNEDFDKAYYFYLQAAYAIRLRKKVVDYIGDDKVFNAIQKCLEETYPKTSYYKDKNIYQYDLCNILNANIIGDSRMLAKINVVGQNAHLILRNADENKRLLVTIPQLNFCGKVDKLNIKLKGYQSHELFEGKNNTFVFDSQEGECFYYHGTKVAQISMDGWGISKSIISNDKECKIASCWFFANGPKYDYICDGDYSVGDKVRVTIHGEEAEIVSISMKKASELVLPLWKYKHI